MNDFTPLSALLGGALIGISSSLLFLTHGKVAGISGLYGDIFRRRTGDRGFRFSFIAGLVAAGLFIRVVFPSAFDSTWSAAVPVLFAAGVLVGYGTQLGSGCTSGHGVCGISRLSMRSVIATATFMAAAMITVFLVRHVIGGAR